MAWCLVKHRDNFVFALHRPLPLTGKLDPARSYTTAGIASEFNILFI